MLVLNEGEKEEKMEGSAGNAAVELRKKMTSLKTQYIDEKGAKKAY